VRHGFTHFELEMEVYVANFRARPNGEGIWLPATEIGGAALPTIMRKLIDHARDADAPLLAQLSSARTC
jgi:A/G-specific adenine glycosylase